MTASSLMLKMFLLFLFIFPTMVLAEDSVQPYIDRAREQLKKEGKKSQPDASSTEVDPYIQSEKKRLESEKPTRDLDESYIERLKATDPQRYKKEVPQNSYSEEEKSKLSPENPESAIQATLEGHSELKAKKVGDIHHAFGLRYGAVMNREITVAPAVQGQPFNTIYGENYAPNASIFYEYQPFHSEWYGNVGIVGIIGFEYYHGFGQFAAPISKPGGGTFDQSSDVKFQFLEFPVTLALNYRFNLARLIRPYVMAGPTGIVYYETRNDSMPGHYGHSEGLLVSGGAAILLDWISSGNSWDLYEGYKIKHYYLTLDYTRIITLSGDVRFTISGFIAGLTFEY